MSNEQELLQQLKNDTYKKNFNLYTAFINKGWKKNPEKYKVNNHFSSQNSF